MPCKHDSSFTSCGWHKIQERPNFQNGGSAFSRINFLWSQNDVFRQAVSFRDGTEDTAGIARSHHARRDVARHHAPRADNGPRAYIHTRQNTHMAAKPYIVAYGYGQGVLHQRVALSGINGMRGRVEAALRAYETVSAEGDASAVEDDEIVIGEEVFAQLDVGAEIAPEVMAYPETFTRSPEELAQKGKAFVIL